MAFEPDYSRESPYALTPIVGKFLAYYTHRPVRPHPLDRVITLTDQRYHQRPDLLSTDMYGSPDLYWVIPLRNGLEDPIFDLVVGPRERYVIPHPNFVRTLV